MEKGIYKNIFFGVFIAFLVVIVLAYFSDFNNVIDAISKFSFSKILLVSTISIIVLITKFFRWHYYVHLMKLPVSTKNSILYFTSSLIMSISPGRWGEIIKSYFIKLDYQVKIRDTLPIVIAERTIEFISLIVVGLIGLVVYEKSTTIALVTIFIILILIILLIYGKSQTLIFSILAKVPFVKNYISHVNQFNDKFKILFGIQSFTFMLILSVFSWILESFGFYIILSNFIIDISVFWATINYAISIFLGAISMFPGGVGATEGSLTYLLISQGLNLSDATAVVVLIRFFTLWLSLFIGALGFVILLKNRKIKNSTSKLAELIEKNK